MLSFDKSKLFTNLLITFSIAFIGASLGWMMASGEVFVSALFAGILGWILGAIFGDGRYAR